MQNDDAALDAVAAGLDRIAGWLRRQVPATMSLSTTSALDRLVADGPLRVTELAAREAISQPGVTVLVNRLASAGLAERLPDPTDRRAALVRITDDGRAALAARRAERAGAVRARLALLDPGEQDALITALPALQHLLATGRDAGAVPPDSLDPDRKKSAS